MMPPATETRDGSNHLQGGECYRGPRGRTCDHLWLLVTEHQILDHDGRGQVGHQRRIQS